MHSLADIDHLRDPTVPDDGGEGVRLLATHRHELLAGQPVDGLLNGDLHRLIQVLVVAHEDPVGLRFRPRPIGFHLLVHDRLDLDLLVGAFERRQIHLAVSLPAVRIAGPDQAALEKHRQIQGGSGLQLVEIHVRAVLPGPQRAGAPPGVANGRPGLCIRLARIDPDGKRSGKGLQVDHDSRLELGLHLHQIELVVAHEAFGKFRRQQAHARKIPAGQVEIKCVGLGNNLEYANLERIARLRFRHVDGAGDRVRPAAVVLLAQLHDPTHVQPGFYLSERV